MHQGVFEHILSYGLTFSSRYESYYKMIYSNEHEVTGMVNIIDEDILNHISSHRLYENAVVDNEPSELWKNLLVKHFYNDDFTVEEVTAIEQIKFAFDTEYFYMIPILIYVLEEKIQDVLK
jgi:hypothetical protein